ncbi:hypothetical protein L1049_015780 [Liquidambar formosana]|uniref:PGG domain-containing protein n=1 Tax=Liquidambar formosana TaxID=63359 RepID=A0AAP0X6C0_LIQFO
MAFSVPKVACSPLGSHWTTREIMCLDASKATSIFQPPVLLAAKLGINEVVEEISESFPPAIWSWDREGHTLQMQRELQWYKEVENFVSLDYKEHENFDHKTPAVLFTEEHKDLVKEGEQWMKDTANSWTIAAALIATIAFAAAITVPGGNNGDNGLPIFSNEAAFIIFAVSNALSLFSSTASLLMFLSILTARYAEADFLHALPKRLIIGLVTLFLSIIGMMLTFSATLYLVFGHKKAWILIPVGALASLPVTLFVFLQFPLLVDMIKSTCCHGIFGKKSKHLLC